MRTQLERRRWPDTRTLKADSRGAHSLSATGKAELREQPSLHFVEPAAAATKASAWLAVANDNSSAPFPSLHLARSRNKEARKKRREERRR